MMWLLIVVYIVMNVSSIQANVYNDIEDHECARTCEWPQEPRTCHYVFTVEWLYTMSSACYDCPLNITDCDRPECLPADGVPRPVVVINRQLPGPPIQVCENDEIEVKVWNRLGNSEGTSIHWHGIHQRGTPYMDGATMITQCPISPQSSFTYRFKASPYGTRWWHSHSNLQSADGAFGAFIVKQPQGQEVNGYLYDYDLPEHVVFLQNWLHVPTITRFAAFNINPVFLDSMLINGKGASQGFEDSVKNQTFFTPREVFNIEQGGRYRFRLITHSMCPLIVAVQEHNLTVIAIDGAPVKPLVVDHIALYSGERYDVVITADKPIGNYWFRLYTTDLVCSAVKDQFAILRYDGAADEEPLEDFSDDVSGDEVLLNVRTPDEAHNGLSIVEVESAVPDDDRILRAPDVKRYLEVGINQVSRWNMYDPTDYPNPPLTDFLRDSRQINHRIFKTPPSPPLTQLDDLDEDDFCDVEDEVEEKCREDYCSCTHRIKVKIGQVVEFILVGNDIYGIEHPMHLHGYSFRVVAAGELSPTTTVEDVIQMDQSGNITRTLKGAVLKDTVIVPGHGYVIVRFVADNPGWWLFHCHYNFHVSDGMSIVLQHDTSDLPAKPDGFPQCGSWAPAHDAPSYGKERKNNHEEDEKELHKYRKTSITGGSD